MTTGHPITRAELREELDRTLQHYATKEDLANLKNHLYRWMLGSIAAAVAVATLIDRLWL